MSQLHTILVRPLETEKAHAAQKSGKYSFQVRQNATKKQIALAVEKFYGVKVKSVQTAKIQSKARTVGRGRTLQKRASAKKAIVTTVGAKPIEVSKVRI